MSTRIGDYTLVKDVGLTGNNGLVIFLNRVYLKLNTLNMIFCNGFKKKACKADVLAPVSILVLIRSIPNSGNDTHSRHPTLIGKLFEDRSAIVNFLVYFNNTRAFQ